MSAEPMVILLAEDDEGHALLIQKNIVRAGIANQVVHVADGQAAIDYACRTGPFANRLANGPLLIVLDINMPRVDGIEVLTRVKANEATAKVPVIMLTTTDDPREVERCYEAGCSVYITKPVEYDAFVEAVKRLGLFLQIVQLPPELKI